MLGDKLYLLRHYVGRFVNDPLYIREKLADFIVLHAIYHRMIVAWANALSQHGLPACSANTNNDNIFIRLSFIFFHPANFSILIALVTAFGFLIDTMFVGRFSIVRAS